MAEVISLSARWWTISRALHVPGPGCVELGVAAPASASATA